MARSQWLLLSLLASMLTACVPARQAADDSLTHPNKSSIIGGQDIQGPDNLPHSIVGIYDQQLGQLCTGTLIGRNVVMTAAHCANQDATKMYILFGNNLTENPVVIQVDKMAISPYYNPTAFAQNDGSDLALLHFSGALPEGYEVATLLPLEISQVLKPGAVVTVAGYGVTDGITLEAPKILRKADVIISDVGFGRSEILVDQRSGHGVCHGDSGGPAFIRAHGQTYVWGITSRGINDETGACASLAAFTSTIYHRTWINRMNAKLSSSLINFSWRNPQTTGDL